MMTRLARRTLRALAGALLLANAACEQGQARVHNNDSAQLLIRRDVDRFTTLPDGVRHVEGITANPANGDIYVATFDTPSSEGPDPKNKLLRFDRHGQLVGSHEFGTTPLLGLAFDRADEKVYIANPGNVVGVESRIRLAHQTARAMRTSHPRTRALKFCPAPATSRRSA